jgi:putative membrane protein
MPITGEGVLTAYHTQGVFMDRANHLLMWSGLGVLWILTAYAPADRMTWVLENVLLIGFAAVALASYRLIRWSTASAVATVSFLTLHIIGAYYTYSEVPYQDWMRAIGIEEGPWFSERNHFDRTVHFLYGALLSIPAIEWLCFRGRRLGRAAVYTLALVMCSSLIYEFIEWGACIVFGGDEGMAFLGTQGDIWDAHKDMFAASVGSLLTTGVVLIRGLVREGAASLFRRGPGRQRAALQARCRKV